MSSRRDLSAREVAAVLGISRSTLYAYVSRGLIRSRPAGNGSRERRYAAVDVEALKERQAQRHDPSRAAVTALSWGMPVLESAITLIEHGRLYYRGHDALHLATTRSFEEVVGLLWAGQLETPVELDILETTAAKRDPGSDALSPLERFHVMLPLLGAGDPAVYDLRPHAVMRAGGRILRAMVAEVSGEGKKSRVAASLAGSMASGAPQAEKLIDAALILTADHELNASSFTVRCVASARAPLYDAVGAGIGALRGVRHGAASHRVEALLTEVDTPASAMAVLQDRLRRGEPIPGFGHNLYPDGDPRGRLLLELCGQVAPDNQALALVDAVINAAGELIEERPNVDFGLVALARTLDLPPGSALTLMTLGRTAGWVAHALEQYESDVLIRPRARYVGPTPEAV